MPAQYFDAIISTVKSPLSLAALVILVLMVLFRSILSKTSPVRGKSSFSLMIRLINVLAFLASLVIVGSVAYEFYRVYQSAGKQPLDRVGVEELLQRNRPNIEYCLRELKSAPLYLDFQFTNSPSGINVDIIPGYQRGESFDIHPAIFESGVFQPGDQQYPELESAESLIPGTLHKLPNAVFFVTGYRSLSPEIRIAGPGYKLAADFPHANGCILMAIVDGMRSYSGLANTSGIIHRLITDEGIKYSAEYPDILEKQFCEALSNNNFSIARNILEKFQGKSFENPCNVENNTPADEELLTRLETSFNSLKAENISLEQYVSLKKELLGSEASEEDSKPVVATQK